MSEVTTNVQSWFATPIGTASYPGWSSLNASLRALFIARETDSHRHHIRIPTQIGAVFESRFDLFDWADEPVRELADWVHAALSGMVAGINGYGDAEMRSFEFFYDSWFHITRNGGYQSNHIHPNASWSGIYGVEPGDTGAIFEWVVWISNP